MAVQRRTLIWVGLLLIFVVLLWLLRSVLLPFALGMAIAFLLDPLVAWLERHGVRRVIASAGIILSFFALVTVALILLVPVILEQTSAFAARLPNLLAWARDALLPWVRNLLERFHVPVPAGLSEPSAEVMQRVAAVLTAVVSEVVSRGLAFVNVVALLAITPLVSFYLLRDWPRIVAEVDGWLPRQHRAVIHEQVDKIEQVLSGFARGSALVCAAQAAFYAIALTVIGLDFGLVIGLAAGAISFVPYVGALFGFLSSVGVALYQFWPNWVRVAGVGAIFFAGQFMQDYVLVPRLVGDQVGLHPLWVMFGVLAGGSLFGFLGVLLAVPACAVIGVLVRFAVARYKTSRLYLGDA
jgi:predicted PurR-regulated permease PerM